METTSVSVSFSGLWPYALPNFAAENLLTAEAPARGILLPQMHDLPRPNLPWIVRWLNARHPEVPPLEPVEILSAVESKVGPFVLPERVLGALSLWCRSINTSSNLHFFGRNYVRGVAVSGLTMRVRLDRLFEREPELCETPLRDPLIIVGLQRSGTPYLHRLLSDTDGARPLPLWEAMRPIPPRRGPDMQRSVGDIDWIQGQPDRHHRLAFKRPVGRICVPWRLLLGPRLLHEELVGVQDHTLHAHPLRREASQA